MTLGQFQEKCGAVFRPELRENKGLEHFRRLQDCGKCSGGSQ
jgi:hypothetical protein